MVGYWRMKAHNRWKWTKIVEAAKLLGLIVLYPWWIYDTRHAPFPAILITTVIRKMTQGTGSWTSCNTSHVLSVLRSDGTYQHDPWWVFVALLSSQNKGQTKTWYFYIRYPECWLAEENSSAEFQNILIQSRIASASDLWNSLRISRPAFYTKTTSLNNTGQFANLAANWVFHQYSKSPSGNNSCLPPSYLGSCCTVAQILQHLVHIFLSIQ